MKSLHKFRHGLDTVLSWVCALLFAAMVVVGTYQIVTRYFFGRPSTVSEELLTYSFTWMALLSSALVFGKRDHMRMGFLAKEKACHDLVGANHDHGGKQQGADPAQDGIQPMAELM